LRTCLTNGRKLQGEYEAGCLRRKALPSERKITGKSNGILIETTNKGDRKFGWKTLASREGEKLIIGEHELT
jgi:hypothetical protein